MLPVSASSLAVRSLGTESPASLRQREQYSAVPKSGALRKARVLSIGDDPVLMNSRQLVLESAGYDVVSAASSIGFSEALLQQIDLVVLCHTIEERNEIVHFIRLIRSDLPLLLLDEICREPPRLGEVHVSPKPDTLLSAIDKLLSKQPIAT